MKNYLYILQSDDDRYSVGSTNDLGRRMMQHKNGQTPTTKRMINPKLVFSQELETLGKARTVERKIKSWKRKDFIQQIVRDGIIKNI